jgi:hypothetical protein
MSADIPAQRLTVRCRPESRRTPGHQHHIVLTQPHSPLPSSDSIGGYFSSWRPMTSRWIWLVPSKIWVTLASRM